MSSPAELETALYQALVLADTPSDSDLRPDPSLSVRRVTALRNLRRFDEAESAAHAAIDILSHEPDLLVELGFIYSDQAKHEAALEWFNKALQVDPRNSTALRSRVTALRNLRRFDEAKSAAHAAIDILSHEPDLLVELGFIYSDQAKHEAALKWFNMALQVDPRNGTALRSQVMALRNLSQFDRVESAARTTPTYEVLVPGRFGRTGHLSGFSAQGIFISYRREDAAPYARLLQFQLSERFPDAHVFMDLDSIEAGLDFAEVIREAVDSCTVLVALIGRQWTTLVDEERAPAA